MIPLSVLSFVAVAVALRALASFRTDSVISAVDLFHCGSIAERTGPLLSSETRAQIVGA